MVRRSSPLRVAALVAAIATGCARPRTPPPAVLPGDGDGGLHVVLTWDAPADLALYVTDPRGETFYYAKPGDVFVRDARCGEGAGPRVEEVRWRRPEPGRYRIGVDFPEACAAGVDTVAYRVVVDLGGGRHEQLGVAKLLERNPVAVEVEIP